MVEFEMFLVKSKNHHSDCNVRENDDENFERKSMKRAQILALAGAVQAIRSDWDHSGIVSQLTKAANTWEGTEAELAAHAMAVAASPSAQTPGAFNARRPISIPPPQINGFTEKEPLCFICGNPKSGCERQQDFEIAHGLNPHAFETVEDTERNTAPLTPTRKQQLAQLIRVTKRLDDHI